MSSTIISTRLPPSPRILKPELPSRPVLLATPVTASIRDGAWRTYRFGRSRATSRMSWILVDLDLRGANHVHRDRQVFKELLVPRTADDHLPQDPGLRGTGVLGARRHSGQTGQRRQNPQASGVRRGKKLTSIMPVRDRIIGGNRSSNTGRPQESLMRILCFPGFFVR